MATFDQQLPLDIPALTAAAVPDPTTAIQYALIDRDGQRRIFGDQLWLAGLANYPDHEVHQRAITITYGDWTPATLAERNTP